MPLGAHLIASAAQQHDPSARCAGPRTCSSSSSSHAPSRAKLMPSVGSGSSGGTSSHGSATCAVVRPGDKAVCGKRRAWQTDRHRLAGLRHLRQCPEHGAARLCARCGSSWVGAGGPIAVLVAVNTPVTLRPQHKLMPSAHLPRAVGVAVQAQVCLVGVALVVECIRLRQTGAKPPLGSS